MSVSVPLNEIEILQEWKINVVQMDFQLPRTVFSRRNTRFVRRDNSMLHRDLLVNGIKERSCMILNKAKRI